MAFHAHSLQGMLSFGAFDH